MVHLSARVSNAARPPQTAADAEDNSDLDFKLLDLFLRQHGGLFQIVDKPPTHNPGPSIVGELRQWQQIAVRYGRWEWGSSSASNAACTVYNSNEFLLSLKEGRLNIAPLASSECLLEIFPPELPLDVQWEFATEVELGPDLDQILAFAHVLHAPKCASRNKKAEENRHS